MQISFEIDHSKSRISSRGDGEITGDILLSHERERLQPTIAPYAELLDLRNASTNMTDVDMLRIVAERRSLAQLIDAGPTAVIASDGVLFGMFRVFGALTFELRPIMVYYNIEPAVEWLDAVSQMAKSAAQG